ncbi:hypothetical protein EMIHUDRAFT_435667, partial [Emiliania huxleyi CCMP1516]|uniref:Uncharacterized protein n=2 Tax=Emiliania huxleyi TaxID=2903 RepID=A0A0D3JDS1_EMIH1
MLTLPSLSHVVGCDEHRLPAALRPQTAPRRSAESTTQRQRRPSRLAAAAFSSLTRMKRPAQTAEPEEGTLTSQAWRASMASLAAAILASNAATAGGGRGEAR